MRLLFSLDTKDYNPNGTALIRPSVRGIIIRGGKIAMVHSLKYDYYKFPGGGMEEGEDHLATLLREVHEESGLLVLPETVEEYGMVHRAQKGKGTDMFIQDNFYYLCRVQEQAVEQDLDDYEAQERFTLEMMEPQKAIEANRRPDHGPKDPLMIEREARVLELLIQEGYFA